MFGRAYGWRGGLPLSYMAAGIGYPYGAIYPICGGFYGYPFLYGYGCGFGGVY